MLFDDEPQNLTDEAAEEPTDKDYPEIILEPLHVLDRLCLKWKLYGLTTPAAPPAQEPPMPAAAPSAPPQEPLIPPSAAFGIHRPPTSHPPTGYLRLLGLLSSGSPWECSISLSNMDRHGGLTLGRDPALCEVVLQEPSISRRHVRFEYINGSVVVTDQNSTNGTFINGRRLNMYEERIALADNSILTLGDISLRVEIFATDSIYIS